MKNFIQKSRLAQFILAFFSIVANVNAFGVTPSATTTQGNINYMSVLDIIAPDVRSKVVKPFGDQFGQFAMAIHDLGYSGYTANKLKRIASEDYIHETFINKNSSTGHSANAAVTLTLDSSAVNSDRGYYPQVQDELRFSDGTVAIIKSVGGTPSAPTFTMYPKTLGETIPDVAAGDEITILSNSFQEGSFGADPRRGSVFFESFTMKTSRSASDATNSSIAEKTWFNDEYGNIGTKGSVEAEMRLMNAISGSVLFDTPKTNSNLSTSNEGSVVGLKSYINSGGQVVNYTPGLFNDTVWDALIAKLEKNNGEQENLVFAGAELYGEIENKYFQTLSVANSAPFLQDGYTIQTKNGRVKGKDLNMTFTSFTKRQYTFQFIKHKEISNPKMYNLPGYKDLYNAFIIPNGVTNRKDDMGNIDTAPYIEILYKNHNGLNRKFVMQKTAGMTGKAGENQTRQDITIYDCLSEYMAVYTCKNKFAYLNSL